MTRIGRNYTVVQDGKGGAKIVKKKWKALDASAQIRARKSKKMRVQRPQINFGPPR